MHSNMHIAIRMVVVEEVMVIHTVVATEVVKVYLTIITIIHTITIVMGIVTMNHNYKEIIQL